MPAQAGEAETWACAHVRRRKAWYSLARAKATQGSLGARAPFRLRKRAAPRHVQQTASRRPSSPTVPLAQRAASSCAASHRRSRYEQDASEPRRAFAACEGPSTNMENMEMHGMRRLWMEEAEIHGILRRLTRFMHFLRLPNLRQRIRFCSGRKMHFVLHFCVSRGQTTSRSSDGNATLCRRRSTARHGTA